MTDKKNHDMAERNSLELTALQKITQIMDTLEQDTRARIASWVHQKWGFGQIMYPDGYEQSYDLKYYIIESELHSCAHEWSEATAPVCMKCGILKFAFTTITVSNR